MAELGAVFLLGVTMGVGPCILHHMAVVVPFVGAARRGAGAGLLDVAAFSASRTAVYALLGAAAGGVGGMAGDVLGGGPALAARGALGLLLAGLAVGLLFRGPDHCPGTDPGQAMAMAGILAALTPCPGVLAVMALAASAQSALYGLVAGLLFGAGNSVSPLLLLGPLAGWLGGRGQGITRVMRLAGALIMFTLGVHMVVSTVVLLSRM